MFPRRITLAMAFTTVLSTSAFAGSVTTYTSIASFDAATTGDTAVTFPYVQFGQAGCFGSSLTDGNVIFAVNAPSLCIAHPSNSNPPFMTNEYLSNNGNATSLTINFLSPVYGFALDFGSINNRGNASSLTETFSFAGTSTTVNLPGELIDPGVPLSFIGFTSSTAFSEVTITDPTEGFAMNNLVYTTNTADTTDSPVPEPASIALFGLGLLGITTLRRKSETTN